MSASPAGVPSHSLNWRTLWVHIVSCFSMDKAVEKV